MSEQQHLDELLRLNPDAREPHLVMADWLSERGDPRGELAMLQDRMKAADLLPAATAIIKANLSRWVGFETNLEEVRIDDCGDLKAIAREVTVAFRWGFIRGVETMLHRLSDLWDREEVLLRWFAAGGASAGETAMLIRSRSERDRSLIQGAASLRSRLVRDDLQEMAQLPDLRALSLDWFSIEDLVPILERLDRLRYLRLDHATRLDDTRLAPLTSMTSLRHLSLFGCTSLTGVFLEGLGEMETLALGRIDLDDDAFARLLRFRELRRLDLSETTLSNARLRAIVDAMPKLERLSLRRTRGISRDGFLPLLELPHLERLEVAGTPFRHSGRFSDRAFERVVSFAPAREPFEPTPAVYH